VRRANSITFFAADGAKEFRELLKATFSSADLASVRIEAMTGGAKSELDILIVEIRIRADRLPNTSDADARLESERGSWRFLGFGAFGAVLLLASLFAVRRRWSSAHNHDARGV
jgi:hypothetical protein